MSHEGVLRLLKFSFVGAIGIGVQLSVLAALTAIKIEYLLATALAVESAVFHNFLWHRRFTWPDRTRSGLHDFLQSLLRFQLSNGLVSMLGNLVLMRFLVGGLKHPLIPSNLVTITACFAANFLASDHWVFRLRHRDQERKK